MQYRSQSWRVLPQKLARRLLRQITGVFGSGSPSGAVRSSIVAGRQATKGQGDMAKPTLTISSKNYSSWSLRGWLLAKFGGLDFDEVVVGPDDASARAEILLLSSSILVPCLRHDGATIWDTLAIAEDLNEAMPDAG